MKERKFLFYFYDHFFFFCIDISIILLLNINKNISDLLNILIIVDKFIYQYIKNRSDSPFGMIIDHVVSMVKFSCDGP